MSLQAELKGVPEAVRALDRFGKGVQRKQIRIALSAAGGVIKQEVAKRAPRATGTLAKYQIVKTALSKNREVAYTIVGAKRGVKVAVSNTKGKGLKKIASWIARKDGVLVIQGQRKFEKALDAGKSIRYRVPSRYSHLAEGGNKFGAKPHRYLARSIASSQHKAAQAAINKLRKGVEEERRKAATRAR